MSFDNFIPRGRFGKVGAENFALYVNSGPVVELDNTDQFIWLLRTPVEPYIHFVFEFQSSKNGEIIFTRNPIITDVGTSCECDNNNDNIDAACQMQIYHQPTYSNIGDVFFSAVIGTDSTAVVQPTGGKYERERKRVLKRDTDYILGYRSLADGNRMSHLFTFAEEA